MNDSIFAKIISGDIPCHKIYEDESTLVFLDIHPKNEGHALVIPKIRPAEFVWDLDDTIYHDMMVTAKKVALRLRTVLAHPYVHQAIIGTDVPYAHIHLIPFTVASDLHGGDPAAEPNHAALAALAERLYFEG